MVKVNVSDFLKSTDIKGETRVVFIDEGAHRDSQFKDPDGNAKQNFNITVRLGDEDKTWTMNKTSQRKVSEVYGDESSAWVGKSAKLIVVQMMVGKDMRDVIMGEADDTAPAMAQDVPEPEGWAEDDS